jgi:hypothetical protein
VEGFELERVEELAVGVPLNFSVYGSPGSAATLSIEGAHHLLDLPETRPGIYEGTYVLDQLDEIRADSLVVASLQRGGKLARLTLPGSLLLEHNALPWPDDAARISSPRPPTAGLGHHDSAAVAAAGQNASVASDAPAPTSVLPRLPCGDRAVVESIRVVKVMPYGGWLGSVAGALTVAILATQPEADRDSWRRWLAAVGGAVAGRQIEPQAVQQKRYEVAFRLPDGSALLYRYDKVPAFRPGDTVNLSGISRCGAPPVIS